MQRARARLSPDRVMLIAAVAVLLVGLQMSAAHYLSPRTGIGYTLGIVGGVMLLVQAMYSLRKRLASLAFLGSLAAWFHLHILLGIAAPVVVLMHCAFSLGSANSTLALICLLLVAGSGLFGRHFYAKIHQGLYGPRMSLAELQRSAQSVKERGTRLLVVPELADRLEEEERRLLTPAGWGNPGLILAPFVIASRFSKGCSRLCDHARAGINVASARHKAVAVQRERFERITCDYLVMRLRTIREVADFRVYERLFSVWHMLHVPLFLMLLAAGIVHVISVHVY
jgi:hypothetical protein